jgi:hypothetical protein
LILGVREGWWIFGNLCLVSKIEFWGGNPEEEQCVAGIFEEQEVLLVTVFPLTQAHSPDTASSCYTAPKVNQKTEQSGKAFN